MFAVERFAAIQMRGDLRGQLVRLDVFGQQLRDHVEVALRDVVQGEVGIAKLIDEQQVVNEFAGEADAAGSDEGDLDGHLAFHPSGCGGITVLTVNAVIQR